jgi:hypothetical protein
MNKNTVIVCLAVGSLLALAAGCGKSESAPPVTQESAKTPNAPKVEPVPTIEKAAIPATNAAVTVTAPAKTAPEAVKAVAEAPVKATDTPMAPVKQPASEVAPAPAAATNATQSVVDQTKTDLASLSQGQMVKGLEDALGKGLQHAIATLGHDSGFLTNLNVKIPMPEKMQKVEATLRAMKQDKLADDFVATMNHAAEQAVPEAGTVFADALKQMSIEDAKSILTGPDDAATQYFQKTTRTNLYPKFYPIVQKATSNAGVTAAYKNLMEKANVTSSLGSFGSALGGALLDKDSLDLDAYVTNKALDGLFKMVAAEEKQIRQNPVARTTDTLQKVFGALSKPPGTTKSGQ